MSNWQSTNLGSVLQVRYGKDHKSLSGGTYPCIGSGGVMRFVNTSLYEEESILIPRKGSLNNIMYMDKPFWTVDTMFWTKIDMSVANPKFLFYQLTQIDYENLNVGSAVPSLTVPVINDIAVTLPSLKEQQAIAEVLSSLDDKIDLLHRQNQTLEQMAETLFRKWFIDLEFDSTIADLIYIQNGYAFKSKDFSDSGNNKVIKIKNISNNIVDISNCDCVSDDIAKTISDKFKIVSGDILFAMTGAEIGKMGIVENNGKSLWLNQRVGLFKEKFEGAKYLAYLCLLSDFGQDYILNTATGSAQPNISSSGIEQCPFPKLSLQEIQSKGIILVDIFRKVNYNLGQVKSLQTLRDTLLPKLMNGQARVKIG